MPRPTARVLALLELLQAGGTRPVAELAARLGVDERTVRRYVAHLIDLDVPIDSVRGRYGGYRLAPGYRMPPLMLTDDEALAVVLGLAAARRTGAAAVPAAAVESAAAKVRRVLPAAAGRRLDAVDTTVELTVPAHRERASPAVPGTAVLLELAQAARDRHPVVVDHTTHDGRRRERTVRPYGIVAHSGRWYLVGEDASSDEVRTFRLDRIARARVLSGTFAVPAGFDPAERVLDGLAAVPRRHAVSVRVDSTVDHVRSRLPAGIATVEELPDEAGAAGSGTAGWVRVRLGAERLGWVAAALAGLDRPLVVEHPEALREEVRALAHRLAGYVDDDL